MLVLFLRVLVSLALVLGLFWLVARYGTRRLGGSRSLVRVLGRQQLSRGSSLAVVEVGERVLVVGVSDGGVRLLTELEPDELPVAEKAPTQQSATDGVASPVTGPSGSGLSGSKLPGPRLPGSGLSGSRLSGSMLSGQTWKQAWAAATGRVSRD
ncbi:MAG TPA: flagellar biosynthetic protein FliO [Nocardioidaceae bacterium]